MAPITLRQREVVALIAAGCSNDEVGTTPRDLPQDGEGALRRASTEARRASTPADSDRVPTADGRGSAVCGAPLHWLRPGYPADPRVPAAASSRALLRSDRVLGSARRFRCRSGEGDDCDSLRGADPQAQDRRAAAAVRAPRRLEGARADAHRAGRLREDDAGRAVGRARRSARRPGSRRVRRRPTSPRSRSGIAKSATAIVEDCDVRLRTHMRALPAPAENVQTLAEILGEDLAEWPSDAWLVIDDYHEIAQEPQGRGLRRTRSSRSRRSSS